MFSKELVDWCVLIQNAPISANNLKYKHQRFLLLLLEETRFLGDSASLRQRLWHVVNNTIDNPKCFECKINNVNWKRKEYAKFCCPRCGTLNSETKEKSKESCIERFGVEHAFQSSEVKKKIDATNIERYGDKNPAKTNTIREKYKTTILSKYGVDHYSKTEDFVTKRKNSCEIKYDRSTHNQQHISEDILNKLNDREWLYDQHIVKEKFLIEIGQELGISDVTIGNYLRKHNIITQQHKTSLQEISIRKFLEQYFDVVPNLKLFGRKEVDIFIPEKNVAIEYNGLFHHSSFKKSVGSHQQKYKLCKEKGIKLLTIYEDEWIQKTELVKSKLLHILGISNTKKIFARKCMIIELSPQDKKKFLDSFHIQGNGKGSINLGLIYENEICAVMTFFKRSSGIFELNRYATKYNVIGGFTKLLECFKRSYVWDSIITFADLRWHSGDVYLNSGFILEKTLSPDYEYIVNKTRVHKSNFRKDLIKKKFPNEYDETKTEFENMDFLKIPRIYDCGKLKFVMNMETK